MEEVNKEQPPLRLIHELPKLVIDYKKEFIELAIKWGKERGIDKMEGDERKEAGSKLINDLFDENLDSNRILNVDDGKGGIGATIQLSSVITLDGYDSLADRNLAAIVVWTKVTNVPVARTGPHFDCVGVFNGIHYEVSHRQNLFIFRSYEAESDEGMVWLARPIHPKVKEGEKCTGEKLALMVAMALHGYYDYGLEHMFELTHHDRRNTRGVSA